MRTLSRLSLPVLFLVPFLFASSFAKTLPAEQESLPTIEEWTDSMQRHDGFFPFYWDEPEGKVWLVIPKLNSDFLYVHSLSTGLGSNPVGLDRGQLGRERVVRFRRVGPKILLEEPNLRYRALTANDAERRAVEESFARSILWSAPVQAESEGRVLVDATDLLFRDAHHVARTLKRTGQGSYKLDSHRSAVHLPRSKTFPENTELDVILTFTSEEGGPLVTETSPTAEAVTLHQHHSLIRLPEEGYQTRNFDPRSGALQLTFYDYASPLDQPLARKLALRHRLIKKDPGAAVSEAVEPIVYYVDRGAPEPVRSALIEGASWWNQAFEAAGFQDAFRVELLPEEADPMDVRYNVIQWVHRSTRGWSYGGSVIDPRTGEILKGHVTLGSLRIRQDRMIIEGLKKEAGLAHQPADGCRMGSLMGAELLAQLDQDTNPVEVALARIRQLSAHEVGHTLGFAHNFAASTMNRASVMDYPAPLVRINGEQELDLSDAYSTGIGEWDKVSVRFLYSQFPEEADQARELESVLQEGLDRGLYFMSDADARPAGAAHPFANLWDNGEDPVRELEHVLQVRRLALEKYGSGKVDPGRPLSLLAENVVPIYLFHRYQVEAAAKMLGGLNYRYVLNGDGQPAPQSVSPQEQRRSLEALLRTLEPAELQFPDSLLSQLTPPAYGYFDGKEQFSGRMAMVFDPLAAAESAADLTVQALLQPQRAARLVWSHARDESYPGLNEILNRLMQQVWYGEAEADSQKRSILRVVRQTVVERLKDLAFDSTTDAQVRAIARKKLVDLFDSLGDEQPSSEVTEQAFRQMIREEIERFLDRPYPQAERPELLEAPPGSPIGGMEGN